MLFSTKDYSINKMYGRIWIDNLMTVAIIFSL